MATLKIATKEFKSRLFLGTGKYGPMETMAASIVQAETEMVTVALKRITTDKSTADNHHCSRGAWDIMDYLRHPGIHLLANTSGARNASEAVLAARLAREVMGNAWIKLEIHPDPRYLMPDPVETLEATVQLVKDGFTVLPYIHADPVLCKRLEDAGASAVMPLGSPIGSNKGLKTIDFLQIIIEQSHVPVIIDAGIGAPSHAALAMELGADAVLVNTAIATANDPILMAEAFKEAVVAGRKAYEAGLPGSLDRQPGLGNATSPLTAFLGSD